MRSARVGAARPAGTTPSRGNRESGRRECHNERHNVRHVGGAGMTKLYDKRLTDTIEFIETRARLPRNAAYRKDSVRWN